MGAVIRIFPLILAVVIVYNLVWLGTSTLGGQEALDASGHLAMGQVLDQPLIRLVMVSGEFPISWSTIFVTVGLVCLFVEILRSASSDAVAITNHALSLVTLVFCLIEFVVVDGFNTPTFFYLTMMAMIDVVAGFTVSIISSRRDFGGPGVAL